MTPEQKLSFIHKMTKLGLEHVQHLDAGGPVVPPGTNIPVNNTSPSGTTLPGPSSNGTGYANGPGGATSNPTASASGVNNNFQAGAANIQAGTNANQLNQAYTGSQNAANAGIGLSNQLQPGVAQGTNAQSVLSTQLAAEANGQGPNPAQAALNQSTAQNISQQAALAAGTRGAGANAGLIAENNAQQGAATQQQAVGQAATLEAQQQLAAQSAQQNLASTQVSQGAQAITGVNQEQQNEQSILQNANTAYNNAGVTMQENINNANLSASEANQAAGQSGVGGFLNSIGGLFAHGGMVKMDKGGNVLDANARKHIAEHNFALPGRRYPIHDIAHARNALARVSQNGTAAEKKTVKAAVHKKYPSLAGNKMAKGGEVRHMDSGGSVDLDTTAVNTGGPQLEQPGANPVKNQGLVGGLLQSVGVSLAHGGEAHMASGGYMTPTPLTFQGGSGPQSFVGKWLATPVGSNGPSGAGSPAAAPQSAVSSSSGASGVGGAVKVGQGIYGKIQASNNAAAMEKGTNDVEGANDPNFNPTSTDLPASNTPDAAAAGDSGSEVAANDAGATEAADAGADAAADAGAADAGSDDAVGALLAAKGGPVKAKDAKQKAVAKGDNLKNDKVPAMLSEGEVVMDRETLADPGPVGQMARAVAKHIEARNKRQGRKQ